MSGAFVAKLTNVLAKIQEHGRAITYRKKVTTANPTSPWEPTITYYTYSLKGIFNFAKESSVIGGYVRREDDQVIINYNDLGFEPQIGDEVLDTDFTYTIVNSQTVQPGDIPIICILDVKR